MGDTSIFRKAECCMTCDYFSGISVKQPAPNWFSPDPFGKCNLHKCEVHCGQVCDNWEED